MEIFFAFPIRIKFLHCLPLCHPEFSLCNSEVYTFMFINYMPIFSPLDSWAYSWNKVWSMLVVLVVFTEPHNNLAMVVSASMVLCSYRKSGAPPA